MGLTISNLFTRLFGKKQMRILMGKQNIALVLVYCFILYFIEYVMPSGCHYAALFKFIG